MAWDGPKASAAVWLVTRGEGNVLNVHCTRTINEYIGYRNVIMDDMGEAAVYRWKAMFLCKLPLWVVFPWRRFLGWRLSACTDQSHSKQPLKRKFHIWSLSLWQSYHTLVTIRASAGHPLLVYGSYTFGLLNHVSVSNAWLSFVCAQRPTGPRTAFVTWTKPVTPWRWLSPQSWLSSLLSRGEISSGSLTGVKRWEVRGASQESLPRPTPHFPCLLPCGNQQNLGGGIMGCRKSTWAFVTGLQRRDCSWRNPLEHSFSCTSQ